jgi:pimeloyl-ACP methyl ester carboxylesterase
MTLVLLHGVPEDRHIWDELRSELGTLETVALNLPGFGTPMPHGFEPTMDGYATWLASELEAIGHPVCLVGHDWGGILTSRIATTRPELVAAFATDVLSFFHPDFAWHPLARIWATPGAGEAFMEEQAKRSVEERTAQYTEFGVARPYAQHLAAVDPEKNRCILALYRSSTQLYAQWGKDAAQPGKPGIHIMGTSDPFAAPALSTPIRERFGLAFEPLEGVGHFWPSQAPKAGAAILRRFYQQFGG